MAARVEARAAEQAREEASQAEVEAERRAASGVEVSSSGSKSEDAEICLRPRLRLPQGAMPSSSSPKKIYFKA